MYDFVWSTRRGLYTDNKLIELHTWRATQQYTPACNMHVRQHKSKYSVHIYTRIELSVIHILYDICTYITPIRSALINNKISRRTSTRDESAAPNWRNETKATTGVTANAVTTGRAIRANATSNIPSWYMSYFTCMHACVRNTLCFVLCTRSIDMIVDFNTHKQKPGGVSLGQQKVSPPTQEQNILRGLSN